MHDRKIGILAVASIFSTVPGEVSSIPGLSEQLVRAALTLFEGLPKAMARRKQLEEDFDKDDDDDDEDDEEDELDDDVDVGDEDDVYDDDNEYQELLASKQVSLTYIMARVVLRLQLIPSYFFLGAERIGPRILICGGRSCEWNQPC